MNLVDMHTHTSLSDGEISPNDLIRMAINSGIKTLSITDHDNVNAYSLINYEEFKDKIELFTGIELSAKVSKGRLHILGYDVAVNDQEFINHTLEIRRNNFYSMIALLNQLRLDFGIAFSCDEICDIFNAPHNIGRPDVAKLLVKHGYCKTSQETFGAYLNHSYDKVRDKNITKSSKECIEIILNAGGVPVLAHPNQLELTNEELKKFVGELKSYGLVGIEAYHSGHSLEETAYYLYLAKYYDLLISGGSDYHGPVLKPDVELGKMDIQNLSLVNHLRKRK